MFDFMNDDNKDEEEVKNPKNNDSSPKNETSLQQLAMRLEKAADKIIAERDSYKQEINQLQGRIVELEAQINENAIVKKLEAELFKAQDLQIKLEKKVSSLVEKLRDLLEEENI